MDFFKIARGLKAEDVPVCFNKDEEHLRDYLRGQEIEVNVDKISKNIDMSVDKVNDLLEGCSVHWRDRLAPKAFFKAMSNEDDKELETFFQRPDVDLNMLIMERVYDVRRAMKNLGSPSYVLLFDSWKKYRGY